MTQSNPWKMATIAMIASLFAALVSGGVVAKVYNTENQPEGTPVVISELTETVPEPEPAPVVAAATAPAAAPAPHRSIENCEHYRYQTHTDGGRVVKNGLIGGALGAGLGAAGGAIGGNAGKGAGIGAAAGAVVGSGYTLHDESKKKDAARRAYSACLARNGY
ncbi:MAG: hypothetical protein JRG80_00315 [Deltaproteobacteria bacterium]|nr:hypothetical protein [Deltaproteobacteria bacterium]MBW2397696.1 hypothetical protein [Deltaproteobacteria bacterium]MBW2664948.1 hypothetical protein [Deltaproteobacteria bacterium]